MALEGMDTEVVGAASKAIARDAGTLESLIGRADHALGEVATVWRGADSAGFMDEWQRIHRPALQQVLTGVRELTTALDRNVAEQERTSNTYDGSSSAGQRSHSPHTTGPSFAEQMSGSKHKAADRDMMLLSQAVEDPSGHAKLPDGYHVVSDSELRQLGIDPSELNPRSGMNAQIYEDSQGHYVLAFAGTNPGDWKDWGADGAQAFAFNTPVGDVNSLQYVDAVRLGQQLHQAVGDNMVVTGHSMGGGQAAAVSLNTGAPAVTFNAAGLSNSTIDAVTNYPDASVRDYVVHSDPLNGIQDATSLPKSVGTRIELPDVPHVDAPPPDLVGGFNPLKIPDYWKEYYINEPVADALSPHDLSSVERSMDAAYPHDRNA